MENKLENIGVKAVEEIISWVKKAGDVIEEQAPLLIQEALRLELITSWVWAVVFGMILIGSITLLAIAIKNEWEGEAPYWVSFILGVGSLIFTCLQIADIIQVTVAPRTYVIEYLKDLI